MGCLATPREPTTGRPMTSQFAGGRVVVAPRMRSKGRGTCGQLGADRPRLVVVEGVAVTSPHDPYLSLRAMAGYCSVSVRWLRDRLTDPHHPLPCYRLPGSKILVRRSEADA